MKNQELNTFKTLCVFNIRFDTHTEIIICIKCKTEKYPEAWKNKKKIHSKKSKREREDTLIKFYVHETGVVERDGKANGAEVTFENIMLVNIF